MDTHSESKRQHSPRAQEHHINQPSPQHPDLDDTLDSHMFTSISDWRAWLSHNPPPAGHSLKLHIHTERLDNKFTPLVVDTARSRFVQKRSTKESTYLQRRAQQLGIYCNISIPFRDMDTVDVTLSKPPGWRLPQEAILPDPPPPVRQPWHRPYRVAKELAVHQVLHHVGVGTMWEVVG